MNVPLPCNDPPVTEMTNVKDPPIVPVESTVPLSVRVLVPSTSVTANEPDQLPRVWLVMLSLAIASWLPSLDGIAQPEKVVSRSAFTLRVILGSTVMAAETPTLLVSSVSKTVLRASATAST